MNEFSHECTMKEFLFNENLFKKKNDIHKTRQNFFIFLFFSAVINSVQFVLNAHFTVVLGLTTLGNFCIQS